MRYLESAQVAVCRSDKNSFVQTLSGEEKLRDPTRLY